MLVNWPVAYCCAGTLALCKTALLAKVQFGEGGGYQVASANQHLQRLAAGAGAESRLPCCDGLGDREVLELAVLIPQTVWVLGGFGCVCGPSWLVGGCAKCEGSWTCS